MIVSTLTGMSDAMESSILKVEGSFLSGFTGIQIVGHLSEVCKSGLDRAKAALENMGVKIPQKRMLFSILPADLKKDGSHFDLPFAVCLMLLSSGKTAAVDLSRWVFAGELALDGGIRPIKGAVSLALSAIAGDFDGLVIPKGNWNEANVLLEMNPKRRDSFQVLAFESLVPLKEWLFGETRIVLPAFEKPKPRLAPCLIRPNFEDMHMTPLLKNISSVVAVGLHSLLLYGAPGTGKSMFSERLPSIMPPMESQEHMDALKIHSLSTGVISSELLWGRPPFRAPHHQSSAAALLGLPETPGEISLAHGGVLFLDEFPEFRRDIIEALREPLEMGHIRVSRAKRKVMWRSRLTLVAACNNCPCGWFGSKYKTCKCPTTKILAYRRKLSGPILDRIDLHINVPEAESEEEKNIFLLKSVTNTMDTSLDLAQTVTKARAFSLERNQKFGIVYNRDLQAQHMLEASGLSSSEFEKMCSKLLPSRMSRRAVIRALRVARTLGDLAESSEIKEQYLAQAVLWQPEAAALERGDHAYGF